MIVLTLGICLWNYAGPNVAYNIDKTVVTESRENRVAWSEEFVQTYKDELCSTNFKLCVQEAVTVLSTNVDKSVDIIVGALYGAAACMVKRVGHKKKRATDWFDQECARMKRLVKRQLCKFRRTNNREDREKYVNDRRKYKRLLMKKKTEFDEERLTQLKQNFNDPSKFWETIR